MSAEDELAATLAAGAADAQRMKLHYDGLIVDVNPSTTPKTVTVVLDGGTVPLPDVPYEAGYGGFDPVTGAQAVPKSGDVVRIEVVGNRLTVLNRLAR